MNHDEERIKQMLEFFASIEHNRWSNWQKYMHSKIMPTAHDSLMEIGAEWVNRWNRQINTTYDELSEAEKESDREQVYPYIEAMKEYAEQIRQKTIDEAIACVPEPLDYRNRYKEWETPMLELKSMEERGFNMCYDKTITNLEKLK